MCRAVLQSGMGMASAAVLGGLSVWQRKCWALLGVRRLSQPYSLQLCPEVGLDMVIVDCFAGCGRARVRVRLCPRVAYHRLRAQSKHPPDV